MNLGWRYVKEGGYRDSSFPLSEQSLFKGANREGYR